MKRFVVISAVLLSTVQPAMAAGRCSRPYAPVISSSAATTKEDLVRLRKDVQDFIAASDAYQSCMVKNGQGSSSQIASNQADKERVGRTFNALAKTVRS